MADLCSLSDVKAWLATGTDAFPPRDDALLARLISDASDFIQYWLSRDLSLGNWQEIRDGLGGQRAGRFVLEVTPVVDIITLAYRAGLSWRRIQRRPGFSPIVNLPAVDTGVEPTFIGFGFGEGYSFTPTEVSIDLPFPRGIQNILIQYTAGYNPIPGGIRQACIELVVFEYKYRTHIGIKTINIGGIETITYETVAFSMKNLASNTQAALWQYRAAAPILRAVRIPRPVPAIVLEDTTTDIVLEDQVTPITGEPS